MALDNGLGGLGTLGATGTNKTPSKTNTDNMLNTQPTKEKEANRVWLPAPYNVVIEPHDVGGNVTTEGKNYTESKKKFDSIVEKTDATEEAANLRQAWASAPKVSIDDTGTLVLSGNKAFLQSDTAQQLRDIFKEMKGNDYNREALNQQIEAWNTQMQNMSDSMGTTLDALNAVNQGILKTAELGNPHLASLDEYLELVNSATIGSEVNAKNNNTNIFIGYGDNGEKLYKPATDLYKEFNAVDDDLKRSRFRSLTVRASNGDIGAYSEMLYLTGGKDTPANVDYSAWNRFKDFAGIFAANLLAPLAQAADYVTTYVPVFNIPRLAGRAVTAAEEGDIKKFFESDSITKMVDDYYEVNQWQNAYFSQLTPGSTDIAAKTGSGLGSLLGMAYSIWAGNVGNAAMMTGVNVAMNAASNALINTGKGVQYLYTVSSRTGNLQKMVQMSEGLVTGEGVGIANAATNTIRASVVLPTALVQKFPHFADAIASIAARTQILTGIGGGGSIAQLAGKYGDDFGAFVTRLDLAGMGGFADAENFTRTTVNLVGANNLTAMRMQAKGLQIAFQIYAQGNESAIMHVDEYFRRTANGEELGDMGEYILKNVGKDLVFGGAMAGVAGGVKKMAHAIRAARKAPGRTTETINTEAPSSQTGFYSHDSYDTPKLIGPGTEVEADIINTVSSLATVNGESFFISPDVRITPKHYEADVQIDLQYDKNKRYVQYSTAPTSYTVSAIPGSKSTGDYGVAHEDGKGFDTIKVEPADNGFNVVTTTKKADGKVSESIEFHADYDSANLAAQTKAVPTVHPNSIGSSDNVAGLKVAPLEDSRFGSITRVLPNGVSNIKVASGLTYATPDSYMQKLAQHMRANGFTEDDIAKANSAFLNAKEQETFAQAAHTPDEESPFKGVISAFSSTSVPMNAPMLPVSETRVAAQTLAKSGIHASGVKEVSHTSKDVKRKLKDYINDAKSVGFAAGAGYDVVPVVQTFTSGKEILVTDNGLPDAWFSDMSEALKYKNVKGTRGIYKLSDNSPILGRPPITTAELYHPVQTAPVKTTTEEPGSTGPTRDETVIANSTERIGAMLEVLPELRESPTDYCRGIIDTVNEVKSIYNEIAKDVDVAEVYTSYGKLIAGGEENPRLSEDIEKAFQPLTNALNMLGKYFDPSGKSLTKDFYLPTGSSVGKLESIEKVLANEYLDLEHPVEGGFDDILIDPQRVGDSGFWQKRSGDLFRDETGEFTMDKSATLEENLVAYTVSALTRGQNRLTVATNNEVARAKFDRNRNQITEKQAYAGLKEADKIRGQTRAAQIKNAKGLYATGAGGEKITKGEKVSELATDYGEEDRAAIQAIFDSKKFAQDINYVVNTNKTAQEKLGYRATLNISNIQGSALRFGSNTNNLWKRGITTSIRKWEQINVTGTKWVTRYGEKVNVGFGLNESQKSTYGFTRSEGAVNLGESYQIALNPDMTAKTIFSDLRNALADYQSTGGWDLQNRLRDIVIERFPLVDNPEYEAAALVREFARNAGNGIDQTDVYLRDVSSLSDWLVRNAMGNINSAIKMSDIGNMDNRTLSALDEGMAYLNIGTPVYRSRVMSGIQTAAVYGALALNPSPAIGNMITEPLRVSTMLGDKVAILAWKDMLSPSKLAKVENILSDHSSSYSENIRDVGYAAKLKNSIDKVKSAGGKVAMAPLELSEHFKNVYMFMGAMRNAESLFPGDPDKQALHALQTYHDMAIASGPGTTPGFATSTAGKAVSVFRTFTMRYWDDMFEFAKKVGYGESGSKYWDSKHSGKTDARGKKQFEKGKAARFIGRTFLRQYFLWMTVLGPLGKSIWDALGGDPSGLSDTGRDRGLYDDENTDENEGMTWIDNIINGIPAGYVFGVLQDIYFAMRRQGVEQGDFLGIDFLSDAKFADDMKRKLPFGVAAKRFGDMLELVDRGYSTNGKGNKTYEAPQTTFDLLRGFAFGKNTTSNAMAYNKYRYGTVDTFGDLFSGDWMDFAMSVNPFNDGGFDSTRESYNGVFDGTFNDISTMQTAIIDLRNRRKTIIEEYNADLDKWDGPFKDLNDAEKKELAQQRREEKIGKFTEDVQRLVDAFTDAGNTLSDNQISSLMYLFDFNESEGDDDEFESNKAQRRYVEAGLPDKEAWIARTNTDKTTGEIKQVSPFDKKSSLVIGNAEQGFYGTRREAKGAIDNVLKDFEPTYKEYKAKVTEMNNKAYDSKTSKSEKKQLQKDVQKVQEEYLEKLYNELTPFVEEYGTTMLSDNKVIEELKGYMSSMIPYDSIDDSGSKFISGNDVVWGRLSKWIKERWGDKAPTGPSDKEVTDGIKEIEALIDQGKKGSAVSKANDILEKIGRGTLGARDADVKKLRDVVAVPTYNTKTK